MYSNTKHDRHQAVSSVIPSLGFKKPDGSIVETIYNLRTKRVKFASLSPDGSPTYTDAEITVPEFEETFIPMNHPYFKSGILTTADEIFSPGTPLELISEIKGLILKYMDLPMVSAEIISRYVLFTWVYDKWRTVPYLRFLGPMRAGKSRMLDILKALCYRSLNIGAGVTVANIFRANNEVMGTLVFDEFNLQCSSRYDPTVQILNNGINDDGVVLRTDKEGISRPYRVFGPKILANHTSFTDPALESRMITIVLAETERTDLPISLPKLEEWDETRHLRNQLLGYRLSSWKDNLPERKVEGLDTFSRRFADNVRPLFQASGEEIIAKDLLEHFDILEEQTENTQPLEEIMIVQYIHDQSILGKKSVYPGEITQALIADGLDVSSKFIGGFLRMMRLNSRRGNKGYCYEIPTGAIDRISKLYHIT